MPWAVPSLAAVAKFRYDSAPPRPATAIRLGCLQGRGGIVATAPRGARNRRRHRTDRTTPTPPANQRSVLGQDFQCLPGGGGGAAPGAPGSWATSPRRTAPARRASERGGPGRGPGPAHATSRRDRPSARRGGVPLAY